VDLIKTRALLNIRRFNFERCNHYISVAEHSFYVTLLTRELVKIMDLRRPFPAYPDTCQDAALLHDLTEAVLGDIPYLVRKSMDPKALADLEFLAEKELDIVGQLACPSSVLAVVAYADALELAIYLKEERESGNETLLDIERETWGRLVRIIGDDWAPEFVWAAGLLGEEPIYLQSMSKVMPNVIKH